MRARIQSWRTFWALPRAERDTARAAAIGLTATWMGLRVFGFAPWKNFAMRFVRRSTTKNAHGSAPATSANRIMQLEMAAARNLFLKTNCLEQSLVLWSLLQRRGFPAELKFGARKESGRFEAHAWVELEGRAL